LVAATDDNLRPDLGRDGGQLHRGAIDEFKAEMLVRRSHAIWPMSLPRSGGASVSLYSIIADHRSTKFL
jgi:hypothetical protein